jgi:hypothetical protein
MEGYSLTSQSPQWAVVPMDDEEYKSLTCDERYNPDIRFIWKRRSLYLISTEILNSSYVKIKLIIYALFMWGFTEELTFRHRASSI